MANLKEKIKEAAVFAKSEIGKYVQPCDTEGCKYNRKNNGNSACNNPTFKPDNEDLEAGNFEGSHAIWNFYCMRFVRTAFGAPANYKKAEDMYQALKKDNLVKNDKNVPVGAIVFWHWSKYGHIGICSAENKVIHTGVNPALKKKGIRESLINDVTEVLNTYVAKEGVRNSYLGWAYPPDTWLS